MPFYYRIKRLRRKKEKQRIAGKLLKLRKRLESEIPKRKVTDTLLLATWNIREFDSPKYGKRLFESFYYIAEIISSFDIVAIQEVYKDLRALKEVMRILGSNWTFIATDVTEGRSGNKERMTYIYDTNKVSFKNIAGEIVLPMSKLVEEKRQFARTPYLVSFQSGWFKFMLCTVHIYFGAAYGLKFKRRVEEIRKISKFIAKRADEDKENNYILLGDFNIVTPGCDTMYALKGSGFVVPQELKHPTNIGENKFYDQIAFKTKLNELKLGDSDNNAGIFNYFKTVFKDEDYEIYKDRMGAKKGMKKAKKVKYYKDWRTHQISDHYPLWVELKVDFSKRYLQDIAK